MLLLLFAQQVYSPLHSTLSHPSTYPFFLRIIVPHLGGVPNMWLANTAVAAASLVILASATVSASRSSKSLQNLATSSKRLSWYQPLQVQH